jgi:hypothetical protein
MSLTAAAAQQQQQQENVKRKIFTEHIMEMCHRHTNLIFNLFRIPSFSPFLSFLISLMAQAAAATHTCSLRTNNREGSSSSSTFPSFIIRAQDVASNLLFPSVCECHCWPLSPPHHHLLELLELLACYLYFGGSINVCVICCDH